jgi:hypothetical protein
VTHLLGVADSDDVEENVAVAVAVLRGMGERSGECGYVRGCVVWATSGSRNMPIGATMHGHTGNGAQLQKWRTYLELLAVDDAVAEDVLLDECVLQ